MFYASLTLKNFVFLLCLIKFYTGFSSQSRNLQIEYYRNRNYILVFFSFKSPPFCHLLIKILVRTGATSILNSNHFHFFVSDDSK